LKTCRRPIVGVLREPPTRGLILYSYHEARTGAILVEVFKRFANWLRGRFCKPRGGLPRFAGGSLALAPRRPDLDAARGDLGGFFLADEVELGSADVAVAAFSSPMPARCR
jgi:hypothetical protein